jgi:hypothetical protein
MRAFRGARLGVEPHQVTREDAEESEDPWSLVKRPSVITYIPVECLYFSFVKVVLLWNISGYGIRLLCNNMNYFKS